MDKQPKTTAERREAYIREFRVPLSSHSDIRLTARFLDQLDRCKDNDARLLLLFGKGTQK